VFDDTLGAVARQNQTVTISGAGTAALTGLGLGNIVYLGTSGWLTATLSGSTAPATLTLSLKRGTMVAGTYSAGVPITSGVAANSPQTVVVTFKLAQKPPPPTPPGRTVTIVATGNLGCGNDLAKESARVVAAARPDYVFVMGNNIPGPSQGKLTTLQDYMNCYDPTWGQFKEITYASLGPNEVDIDSTQANFGSGTAPGADAYFGQKGVGPAGKNWQSFDLGSWHIVALNAQTPGGYKRPVQIQYNASSEQFAWLDRDLSSSNKKCTLAFWNQAMWISSTKIDQNTEDRYPNHGYRVQDIRGIWVQLYRHNADLVINGTPHIYERFAPMRYDKDYQYPTESEFALDSARGIRQITAGLGGDGPLVAEAAKVTHPLSEYRSGGNGVLKLVLGEGSYTWEFLNTKYSHITDSGTGTCH
jgi:hypothetical protein